MFQNEGNIPHKNLKSAYTVPRSKGGYNMCAIAGILNLDASNSSIEKMLRTMLRRGPDANGIYQTNDTTLIHSRLAVIDPAGGKQPMTFSFHAEEYTIVYNGELYNTDEVRTRLEKLGHRFSGHSDTEVVLHSYAQWGSRCLDELNGIFAFCIWEKKNRRAFLARDRIGVKPLFYSLYQGGLLFASELKTILAYPGFPAAIDLSGAAEILLIGPGRTPGCGVFLGINELEPGCFAYYQDGRLDITRYWKLRDREHTQSFQETAEQVRFLVLDAIKRQMVSDVPIGTFLSGGLDSSIISAVCANEMKKQGRKLDTFSVDYENNADYFVPGKFQPNSDADYIGIMEEHIGSNPHRVIIPAQALVNALEESTQARDLPGMADVDFSLLLFCREIRKDVTVALSGECADEIFGGYPWYRDPEIRQRDGFPWAQSTANRAALMLPDIKAQINAVDYITSRYEDTINQSDILPENAGLERRMKQMVNLNFRWFMQTLLDRKDRMSMYSALEVRVPFCDHRIAQYLYGIPWEMKDYRSVEKGLLRYAVKDLLPAKILWRKKSPYPKTYDPKYLHLVREKLQTILDDPSSPIHSLVNRSSLESLMSMDDTWPWYGQLMRRPQTIAYFCQIDHWLRQYNIDIRI